VPVDQEVVLTAHATGSQIYVVSRETMQCDMTKAPEPPCRHLWSDYWPALRWAYVRDNDCSEVTGTISAQAISPDQHAIPWLLVTVGRANARPHVEKLDALRPFSMVPETRDVTIGEDLIASGLSRLGEFPTIASRSLLAATTSSFLHLLALAR